MGSLRFPGFSDRLKQAMVAAGYATKKGKPDVPAFLRVCPFDPRMFYPWLRGRVPELDTLTRIAEELHVSRAWLLLGDGEGPAPAKPRRVRTISGGSADHPTPSVDDAASGVPLIGRCRAAWVHWWYGAPIWSPMPAWA